MKKRGIFIISKIVTGLFTALLLSMLWQAVCNGLLSDTAQWTKFANWIVQIAQFSDSHLKSFALKLLACCVFINLDGLEKIFVSCGIAGGVLSIIQEVRSRRVKGVFISEMMKSYFPMYGAFMVANLVFSALGQYYCAEGQIISSWFCLIGVMLCLGYIGILFLGTGLHEKTTHLFINRYIKAYAKFFSKSKYERSDKIKSEQISFLCSLTEYIAQEIVNYKKPFCLTNDSLKDQIQEVIESFITGGKGQTNGYISSFHALFTPEKINIDNATLETAMLLELPIIAEKRTAYVNKIELAHIFWDTLFLASKDTERRIQDVCRIFHTYCYNPPDPQKNQPVSFATDYEILGCGLIVSLYKEYYAENSKESPIENCGRFVYSMIQTFLAESQLTSDGDIIKDQMSRISKDLFTLVLIIAAIERYHSSDFIDWGMLSELANKLHYGEFGLELQPHVLEEPIICFMNYALCIIDLLPSPARTIQTAQRKLHLKEFVIQTMSTEFRGEDFKK